MGLCDWVRHSAVHANDGEAMPCHWRFDAVEFFVRSHYKYLTFALRLLSNINGPLSPQLAHTLTWNRTVNLVGDPDRNLEMDLFMEFLNRAYKESSKVSRDQLIPATIERHSTMLAMGFQMEELFDKNRSVRRKHGKPDRSGEVLVVAMGVVQYQLATCIPGRTHHRQQMLRLEDWTTLKDTTKFRGVHYDTYSLDSFTYGTPITNQYNYSIAYITSVTWSLCDRAGMACGIRSL